ADAGDLPPTAAAPARAAVEAAPGARAEPRTIDEAPLAEPETIVVPEPATKPGTTATSDRPTDDVR
ncbi:serine/threonine protein kinase, partial [Candidatus Binatia bacterium]|nr:serine/threonine protein kinase [Candidatus Binatia bacterium]